MGTFIAKIKRDNNNCYKLADREVNTEYTDIDLSDAMLYDPNNTMADQWFYFRNFDQHIACFPPLLQPFNSADWENIDSEKYKNIEFIAFHEGGRFYIQKITHGNYLRKKWFAMNGQNVSYKTQNDLLFINPIPNCIYDQNTHNLYFMSMDKAYAVFPDLKNDYREATNEEIGEFLNSDMISTVDLDATKVGIANRKRITAILRIYNSYNNEQKNTLKNYIHNNVGDALNYTEEGKFVIENDNQLRLLLMGIQQRFYSVPLQEGVQVATSTTKLSNLL